MGKPIDIFAGIADLSRPGKPGSKFGLQILGSRGGKPTLVFNPDEKALAQRCAEAIRVQIGDNLERGLAPDGKPMPGISRATEENRERLARQADRGGAPARVKDPALVAQAQRNFQREYTAPRLGTFTPSPGGPRGVLSGMLRRSFLVRPNRDGTGFTVYVAAKRGRPLGAGDTVAPIQRVFGDVPLWSASAMQQPAIREAMRQAARSLVGRSLFEVLRAGVDLAKQLDALLSAGEDL